MWTRPMDAEEPRQTPSTLWQRTASQDDGIAAGDEMPAWQTIRAAFGSLPDAVCFVAAADGHIVYANPAAERLLGYRGHEWATVTLFDLVQEGKEAQVRQEPLFTLAHLRHREGNITAVEWTLLGSSCDTTAIAIFRPPAATDPAAESERDPLTGLPNRRVFQRRLMDLLSRNQTNFTVFFLDLDDFKQVNDKLGHTAGDRALQHVAERLVRALRPADTVARYGGDEFIILLEGMQGEAAVTKTASRLLHAVATPIVIEACPFHVGASIGIVLGDRRFMDVEEIIHAADGAMYRAKRLGPGGYSIFEHD